MLYEMWHPKKEISSPSKTILDSTSSDVGKAFDDLKKNWPDDLKGFKPMSDEMCGTSVSTTVKPSHGMY